MVLLLSVFLGAVVFAVLLLPFLRTRRWRDSLPQGGLEDLAELVRRKGRVYEEIRTLQLEHDLGHVGEEEYELRLRAFKLRAALLLREHRRVDEELERLGQEVEREVLASRSLREKAVLCLGCQGDLIPGAPRCPTCGLPLESSVSSAGGPA